jgi:hypothetical protein
LYGIALLKAMTYRPASYLGKIVAGEPPAADCHGRRSNSSPDDLDHLACVALTPTKMPPGTQGGI